MRTTCIGGGPAGLTFAILAGTAGHQVTVIERQQPAESFGWGVVFWDDLIRQLHRHDATLARRIMSEAYTWHDQVVSIDDRPPVAIPSHGYSMRRRRLLELLRTRAREVGVRIVTAQYVRDLGYGDDDLLIASDGVGSGVRAQHPEFGTRVQHRRNRYIWLGTDKEFDSFTFPFVSTPAGWLWAHAYGFEPGSSTFIVETAPETWRALGFDRMDGEASARRLQKLFAGPLDGARLQPQEALRHRPAWSQFLQVTNRRWTYGRIALMGDAAHTTHFTIGSGTRLAMEDAMVLADSLAAHGEIGPALAAYEQTRQAAIADAQRAAARSADWYERVERYVVRDTADFARLMDDRRSPVMGRMPVGLYLGLTGLAHRVPVVETSVRRLVSLF